MTPILGIMASQISGHLGGPPVAGYKGWYDASVSSSITSSAGLVSQWNDLSGYGYHLTQATGAYKPTTNVTTQNGKNVLNFTNVSSLKAATASDWTFTNNGTGCTFFIAVKTTGTGFTVYLSTNSVSQTPAGFAFYTNTTSKLIYFNKADIVNTSANNATVSGTFAYLTNVTDPTNGTAAQRTGIQYNQATIIRNNTATSAVDGSAPLRPLALGDYDAAGASGINGSVAEVIFYPSTLSGANILLVQQYLAAKWAL